MIRLLVAFVCCQAVWAPVFKNLFSVEAQVHWKWKQFLSFLFYPLCPFGGTESWVGLDILEKSSYGISFCCVCTSFSLCMSTVKLVLAATWAACILVKVALHQNENKMVQLNANWDVDLTWFLPYMLLLTGHCWMLQNRNWQLMNVHLIQ